MDANLLNAVYDIASVEVGEHFYWNVGNGQVHGQVLINSWIVIAIILAAMGNAEACACSKADHLFHVDESRFLTTLDPFTCNHVVALISATFP